MRNGGAKRSHEQNWHKERSEPLRCSELRIKHFYGAPGAIRTRDLLVRSQTLYPTELRAQEGCFLHLITPPCCFQIR